MSFLQSVQEAQVAAQKVFGANTKFMVARAPAWGHDDCCVLVYGDRHADAAKAFLYATAAEIKTEIGGGFRGSPFYTYSVVTFAKAAETC